MDDLKYKLFQFGVYGTEICQFSEEELRSLIFDIEVEILDSQTFQNLNAKFSMVYFINHKNEILEKHGITKENVQNINITEILNDHYIKMNTFAWLNRIEILNEYHNTPLTIVFNALVTSNDFLQCNKSVVTMKYKKDELETVCNKLCADGYIQSKQVKNKMMYKLTRTNGHIDLYTENNTKTPFYTVVRINNLVESRSDGITTPEIATFLGVNSKAALRDVVRLLKINNNILQFLEVEGKMKRYRYFTKSSYDAYNKKAEQRTVNNSILRKDKLFVLDEMIKNKLPFAISKDWCTKLAEKLNLQYVPDTKNFKKLCIEAGYLIKSIHNDSGAGNYVNVVYTDGMEINEDDFRDARIGSTKKAVLKQPKSAFLKCFLSSKLFLAMDNGYIANESERVRKLESMLNANMIERTELTINQEFINNLTLNDFLSLIYYPMRLYIREYNETQTLYEREYITKTDCQLVDLSMKIECLKIYENFEFTRLSHITNPQSFEKLLVHIDKNRFAIDVEDNLVTVKPNNTNVESCDDTQNENAYFFEVLNEYNKTVPHIEMEKRMEFCDIAKNLGITTDFEKLQRFIDENCSVYVYDALMTCFRDYVHAELPKNKIDEWSTLPSTKLVNLYNEVKRNIIEQECILPAFFATTDRYTTAKVLNMLKSDTIVVTDNKTKNVSYNEVYKKLFTKHAYKSMFPRKYYLNGIPEFVDNSYENKILNYITNLLITEGSVDIEKLCQKIRILSVDEIIAIANLQTDLLQICETENAKYLSLRLDL